MLTSRSLLHATAVALLLLAASSSTARAQARLAPGASVTVRWNDGSTVDWPGTIDRVGPDGRYFVKFRGAVAPDDQWVDATLVRAAQAGAASRAQPGPTGSSAAGPSAPAATARYRVGQGVEVSWKGSWYKATILDAGSGRFKVRYAGYDASWDEWVGPDRLRAAPEPPSAERRTASSPVGRYRCATFDAGQLNVVAEFTLAANGTYVDHLRKGNGRYSHDPRTGTVRFTSGPQKTTAAVRFDPVGPRGKPWLRFTYPGGATLDCYR